MKERIKKLSNVKRRIESKSWGQRSAQFLRKQLFFLSSVLPVWTRQEMRRWTGFYFGKRPTASDVTERCVTLIVTIDTFWLLIINLIVLRDRETNKETPERQTQRQSVQQRDQKRDNQSTTVVYYSPPPTTKATSVSSRQSLSFYCHTHKADRQDKKTKLSSA